MLLQKIVIFALVGDKNSGIVFATAYCVKCALDKIGIKRVRAFPFSPHKLSRRDSHYVVEWIGKVMNWASRENPYIQPKLRYWNIQENK